MGKALRLIASRALGATVEGGVESRALRRHPEISVSVTPFGSLPGMEAETGIYVKDAVDWKGDVGKMPPGAAEGLVKYAIPASVAAAGTLGTAIDPKTGAVVPAKVIKQREVASAKYSPEEMRKRRKIAARKPGALLKAVEIAGVPGPSLS